MKTIDRPNKNKQISITKKETIDRHSKMKCQTFDVKIQMNKLKRNQLEKIDRMFLEQKWYKNYILNWASLSEENKIYKFDTKITKITKKDKDGNYSEVEINSLPAAARQCLLSRMMSNIKTLHTLKIKGIQKCGKLKFSTEETCIDLKQYGTTHKIVSKNMIKIQGIPKSIRVNGLEQFLNIEGIEYANAKLVKKIDSIHFQLTCYIPKDKEVNKSNGKVIGIDFGCETSFTTSEGDKIDVKIEETERLKRLSAKNNKRLIKKFNQEYGYNPDFNNKSDAEKFKRLPHSNNFNKTNLLIKKEYLKIQNKKLDFANKFVAQLKKYEKIIIQDEQLAGWQKDGHGKAISHSILGRVKERLKRLENVHILDKYEPTTKLCTNCGRFHSEMTVKDRIFKCECGVEEDRDTHAAKNMIIIYNFNMTNKVNT